MSNPYQKYKNTAVLSASKEQVLLMLYEGAIKFSKLGLQAAEKNNVADRAKNIMRAYDIVLELQVSLDHKVGGDLPKQLDQLYAYVLDQYSKSNLRGDHTGLAPAIKVLENLYSGWKNAIEQTSKNPGA